VNKAPEYLTAETPRAPRKKVFIKILRLCVLRASAVNKAPEYLTAETPRAPRKEFLSKSSDSANSVPPR
jgi:hypothetical protein